MNDSTAPRARRWLEAAAVFAVLLAIVWWTFGSVLNVRPLGGDNLYMMSWANRTPASELLRLDPVVYPEWRPVAFFTVWLQYRWARLDHVASYHALNLVLWTACVWLVYQLVVRFTSSRAAGFVAAGLVLTDPRAITAQTLIIERQTSLAALFGLCAVWMVTGDRGRPLSMIRAAGLALLCLASALSKEYGLAFAAGIAVYGLFERRMELVIAVASAVAVYLVARWSIAAGADSLYCEYMGYFFVVRKVCYNGVTATGLSQMTYNVVASGVGTLLPGLLTADGKIAIAPLRFAVSAGWLAIALYGWFRERRLLRVAGLVIVANTALNFMVYGGRNQISAVCVLAIAVGVGLSALDHVLRAQPSRLARVALGAVLCVVLSVQAFRTRAEVRQQVDDLLSVDPCIEVTHTEQFDPAFIREVKRKYSMSDPECSGRH